MSRKRSVNQIVAAGAKPGAVAGKKGDKIAGFLHRPYPADWMRLSKSRNYRFNVLALACNCLGSEFQKRCPD